MADVADARKKLLLNLISEVKARLEGKVDSVSFPIPQFIVIGKQSVGKSRLIEGLAGEPFNFVSGTLGSRRPTVLELRNVPGLTPSRWSVFDDASQSWRSYPIKTVMTIVGQAHESCGNSVSEVPIRVKVEGADTVDLGLVDLPGFRAYAKDAVMMDLSKKIDNLVHKFMADDNNVMICVEEAGDAAGFATLGKCKQLDPSYRRTILIRNKLDKYYGDLTPSNVNQWLEGFGDLPDNLVRFAVSLPHWTGADPPKPFSQMRSDVADTDVKTMQSKNASAKYIATIGFDHFRLFMEVKTQQLFADALAPMLTRLKAMKDEHTERMEVISEEIATVKEDSILHATRQAGICFAQSFNFLMEGALSSETNRKTIEEELRAFHAYVEKTQVLQRSDILTNCFPDLDAYINYLRDTVKLPGMDVQLNGGAQFKRLMYEVEVFTRFAGLGQKFSAKDVIQARGSGLHETTWENTITTLMMQSAPSKMREKTAYVGERLKWFFTEQKECTLQFMLAIRGSPEEHMYSNRVYKQAQVIDRNETMKSCIFKAFDDTCARHQQSFMGMWNDWMDSMFQSPLMLLKAGSMPKIGGTYETEIAPTLESTKQRIEEERDSRGGLQKKLKEQVKRIPDDDRYADQAVKMVQSIIEQTFGVIRCAVSDQMELYSKSFFLLPMLRRLEGDMAQLDLLEEDRNRYRARCELLREEATKSSGILTDLDWCIDAVQKFRITCGGGD
uniref:Dynamin GTPase domain-containing protein n=1 Tax=Zooxanthella nutricula TaxID=1333877 RepID=A0A7S2LA20_9DINO